MRAAADAARAEVEGARLCFRGGDEVLQRAPVALRRNHEDAGQLHQRRHPGEILYRIERKVAVEPRHPRLRGGREQQRMPVGLGARDRAGGERSAGAAPLVDDDRPAELAREGLGDGASDDIARGPGRGDADEPDVARGEGLRAGRSVREDDDAGKHDRGGACASHRRSPSSARTIAAPATIAESFARATSRGSATQPQSGAAMRRAAGRTSSAARSRPATAAGVSSRCCPR